MGKAHDGGISIEFYDGEGTKWKTELDWWDCAAYVESMIADGAYQTHEPYDKIGEIMEEHPPCAFLCRLVSVIPRSRVC